MREYRQVPSWPGFLRPLLSVLADGEIWQTKDLFASVVESMGLQESVTREINKSGQPTAYNRAGWALTALRRAEAIEPVQNGQSLITEVGHELLAHHPVEITKQHLAAIPIYVENQRRRQVRPLLPDSDELPTYWFVGAVFAASENDPAYDHTEEFLDEGIWRAQAPHKYAEQIKAMAPGERIAIKATFTRKRDLPFDIDGQTASVMAIRAIGTIVGNPGDGDRVEVDWDPLDEVPAVDWYFWTSRNTVWGIKPDVRRAKSLIDFTFGGVPQDYDSFLTASYWAAKYGSGAASDPDEPDDDVSVEETPGEDTYTVADIVARGSFVPETELAGYLDSLRRKKNLILQGPPGTGKTWLAKRLAYALIGREDRALIHAVQFHPTVSYEDFVRGWRPGGDGKLALVDGQFLKVIDAAKNEPDEDHVLVIEEINRANVAQVMGELLTLLEADKRKGSEALKLTYPKSPDELIYLPENLYLIGTMNLADRSLAIVDFALRRRFAFADLRPQFNSAWRTWVHDKNGIDDGFLRRLGSRIEALNTRIADDRSLGDQYRIGHSFFTPANAQKIGEPQVWLTGVVEQEIRPLLAEYWFDDPARVEQEAAALIGER